MKKQYPCKTSFYQYLKQCMLWHFRYLGLSYFLTDIQNSFDNVSRLTLTHHINSYRKSGTFWRNKLNPTKTMSKWHQTFVTIKKKIDTFFRTKNKHKKGLKILKFFFLCFFRDTTFICSGKHPCTVCYNSDF